MREPRDIVDIAGLRNPQAPPAPATEGGQAAPPSFLMIWYRCCHAYGRLYRDKDGTRYHGRCPKCLASCEVPIGEGGSSRRMFEAS